MQALLRRRVESLTSDGAHGRLRHPDRHPLRRALPHRAQARRGRDGGRLPRRGPGARPARRDQDPRTTATPPTTSSSSASAARRRTRPACSHPNIVSIYDRGEAEGTYYIAMEYLDGRTLKELIVGRGPAPIRIAIDYARQILARGRLRAPARDRPPRHQAAQRARRPGGAPQGDGLRHRALRREPDDRGRLDHRHGAVPLARAGARRAGRPALRPLLGRRRALRDAHRAGAVHRRHAARDRDEAPLRDAGAAVGAAAGRAAATST